MPSTFYLRNKLEVYIAVYAPIQTRASISFMAVENPLQTETGVKCDQCLLIHSLYAKTS